MTEKKKINSRAKGAAGERELANFLKEYGIEARRGQQFKGGADSPDVVANSVFQDIHIECKRVEAGNLYNWLEQAQRDAAEGKKPAVVHRRNGKEWVVILTLTDLIELLTWR